MAKIINPEKQCRKTPKSFSEESQIIGIDKVDYTRGIVLDSLEEFVQSLIVYDGGSVEGSRASQNILMDAVRDEGTGMAAGLLLLGGAINSSGFIERLTNEALSELQSNGRFRRSFDYDAMGTNFFKTFVDGEKVKDKYVLELCAAYVGNEPETKLAEKLGKPLALVCSRVNGRLSIVDDWWFNLNLEDAVREFPLPNEVNVKKWAEYIASGGLSGEEPEFDFKHNNRNFYLSISLDANECLLPEGGSYNERYLKAREKSIVGGAWTTWSEKSFERCNPRKVNPSLVFSVSLPSRDYIKPSAVTPKDIKAVQEARDYIAGLIPSN